MRRIALVGVLAAAGILILRSRMPKLHERAMAHCEAMFERMPDTFPPKKMMLSIEEIRATAERTEQPLRCGCDEAAEPKTNDGVHHAA